MALRPYQQQVFDRTHEHARAGVKSVCIVLSTGAGKTHVGGEFAIRAVAKSRRVWWINGNNKIELADQSARSLAAQGLDVGMVCDGAEWPESPTAPVQVVNPLTAATRVLPEPHLIITDECHRASSATIQALLQRHPGAFHVGLTATPERGDGTGLGSVYQVIVSGPTPSELVAIGALVPCRIERSPGPMRPGTIAMRPADAYALHAVGRRALVFVPNKQATVDTVAEFKALGFRAAAVTDETPKDERKALFAALVARTIDALVGVYVFTEGFDLPAVDCVILGRPYGAAGGMIQSCGRGARPSPATGKVDYLLLDCTGATWLHGRPDEDRFYSLDGMGIRRGSNDPTVDQSYCRVCGAPIAAGDPCVECGTAPREIKPLRVVGGRLIRYEWAEALPTDKRSKMLAKMQWEARGKMTKPQRKRVNGAMVTIPPRPYTMAAVEVKYRACFNGVAPSPEVRAAARQIVKGAEQLAPLLKALEAICAICEPKELSPTCHRPLPLHLESPPPR